MPPSFSHLSATERDESADPLFHNTGITAFDALSDSSVSGAVRLVAITFFP